MMKMPKTSLTEAQAAGGIVAIYGGLNVAACLSNAREIPYAEIYRERTSLIETPIQRLQRAAEDEARRLKDRQQHQ
jgi:hypothetical protein